MTAFSRIAPYLTHPLVLVGFVLLLFFAVHQALIKSGIIRPLSPAAGSNVVRTLLRYGFIVALVSILAGFLMQGWKLYLSTRGGTGAATSVLAEIEGVARGFEALQKQGGLIPQPSTPQEYYHNARVYELNGDYVNARKSYGQYLNFGLPFIDPHMEYQAMLKAQEGKAATAEIYRSLLLKDHNLAVEFASILLLDRQQAIERLKELIIRNPDFAPAYYELSKDYSQERLGRQTLSERALEKAYLKDFVRLDSTGYYLKYFLDKTVAAQQEQDAQVRLKALESLAQDVIKSPLAVSGMLTNDGWIINFDIEESPKEILYKLDSDKEFKSTGFTSNTYRDVRLSQARPYIAAGHLSRGRHVITVKYLDLKGQENGPYTLVFDTEAQRLLQVKDILQTVGSWVGFREYPKGRLLLYFTTLLSYRDAIRRIRYSLDNQSLSLSFPLRPTPGGGTPSFSTDDTVSIEVPLSTKYVCVRVIYADGSESEMRRFSRESDQ